MENITPPIPAKRALAVLDQPAPAEIGTPLSSTSVAASVNPLAWFRSSSLPPCRRSPIVVLAALIDGDTLEIHGTRIRLWGIDAPESSQVSRGEDSLQYRCGAEAANELDAFIARWPVSCLPISLPAAAETSRCGASRLALDQALPTVSR